MSKQICSCSLLLLGTVLSCSFPVWADFVIEFTDGRQITIGHYVDKGRTIAVHTARGIIGFRKEDVKRILPVSADHSANTRLEDLLARPPALEEQEGHAPRHAKESTAAADKNLEERQRELAAESKLTKAMLERLDEQYHSVTQEMDGLWEKHTRDLATGASEDTLAENRRLLQSLDQERNTLLKAAGRADPERLPAWAQ